MAHNDYLIHYGIKGMRWGHRKREERTGRNNKKKKLSKKAKIAIGVGATAAVLTIGYVAGRKLGVIPPIDVKKGQQIVDQIVNKNKASKNLKKLKSSDINPYKSDTNCVSCSGAVALNLRGIKARSVNLKPDGNKFEDMANSLFKNPKIVTMYNPTEEKISSYILKHGEEGANGMVASYFSVGKSKSQFGHAYNYIIENGKVKYVDKQNDNVTMSTMMSLVNKLLPTQIVRTDNLELVDNIAESPFIELLD